MRQAHSFTLTLGGDVLTDDVANRLYEAGCDDALVGSSEGRVYAAFTRDGDTMRDAVASATRDVESAGCTVTHVETEEDDR